MVLACLVPNSCWTFAYATAKMLEHAAAVYHTTRSGFPIHLAGTPGAGAVSLQLIRVWQQQSLPTLEATAGSASSSIRSLLRLICSARCCSYSVFTCVHITHFQLPSPETVSVKLRQRLQCKVG